VAPPPPRWGWHQLDTRWAERLVGDARLGPGDLVLDVGAGTGALTAPLVATGARVIAIEAHPVRALRLRQRFGTAVVVVRADAADLRLPRRPFHVVANPPWALTTALLRRLLQPGGRLCSARLVLQDQVARRWAGPGAPGARRWTHDFDVRLGVPVPPRAFSPPPRTGARVLIVERGPRRIE
jgi:23S rRNA (adenine-N6)-dimethyltransferase